MLLKSDLVINQNVLSLVRAVAIKHLIYQISVGKMSLCQMSVVLMALNEKKYNHIARLNLYFHNFSCLNIIYEPFGKIKIMNFILSHKGNTPWPVQQTCDDRE